MASLLDHSIGGHSCILLQEADSGVVLTPESKVREDAKLIEILTDNGPW